MPKTLSYIFIIAGLLVTMNTSFVSAESKYNIKEMTPEVKEALENRRARFQKIREYKEQGLIGENNEGFLTVLIHSKEVAKIVEAENKDRKTIYETVAQQNNLSHALGTIGKVFAGTQKARAKPGDKVQQEDGQWIGVAR